MTSFLLDKLTKVSQSLANGASSLIIMVEKSMAHRIKKSSVKK
ncbi:hypothetical protein SPHINGO8BC_50251 [Sphingobacterium multivorum]|uniref:Uncharacterized protein n=1 Tax=Sphingobacterium multivorum TaxID=28454 RepID=A0A654BNJ7_SPHMU|nr:hypothetical protein SPHINGO8BC_50251 [Sphingobacterium multivorum]